MRLKAKPTTGLDGSTAQTEIVFLSGGASRLFVCLTDWSLIQISAFQPSTCAVAGPIVTVHNSSNGKIGQSPRVPAFARETKNEKHAKRPRLCDSGSGRGSAYAFQSQVGSLNRFDRFEKLGVRRKVTGRALHSRSRRRAAPRRSECPRAGAFSD